MGAEKSPRAGKRYGKEYQQCYLVIQKREQKREKDRQQGRRKQNKTKNKNASIVPPITNPRGLMLSKRSLKIILFTDLHIIFYLHSRCIFAETSILISFSFFQKDDDVSPRKQADQENFRRMFSLRLFIYLFIYLSTCTKLSLFLYLRIFGDETNKQANR